ncbi:MAG: hypothetical protein HY906_26435 [Deltaproteobacteria bacterium]|nr:hypothetical protein [Deltaproteobacteria bacterium]
MTARPRQPFGPADFVSLAITGAALAALVLLATVWLPSMAKMFDDFGGTPPRLTRLVLASFWAPGCALFLGLGAAAAALIPSRRALRTALLVAVAVLAVLAAATVVLGVYLPVFQLAAAVRAE